MLTQINLMLIQDTIGYYTKNYEDIIFVSSGTGLSSGFFKNFGETQRLELI